MYDLIIFNLYYKNWQTKGRIGRFANFVKCTFISRTHDCTNLCKFCM